MMNTDFIFIVVNAIMIISFIIALIYANGVITERQSKNIKKAPMQIEHRPTIAASYPETETKILEPEKKKGCGSVEKVGWSYEASYWIRYAYELSDCDKDFIIMMNAENAQWDYKRKAIGSEPSYGFCQIHKGYHPNIVNDPRFFTSQEWQLEQCLRLWRGGTKFYGWLNVSRRNASAKNIIFSE